MDREKKDIPMIEQYKVDMELMHAAKTRRAAVVISVLCAIIVLASIIGNILIVDIFTTKYNSRTKDWLDTVKILVEHTGAGGTNEGTETIQQFPPD